MASGVNLSNGCAVLPMSWLVVPRLCAHPHHRCSRACTGNWQAVRRRRRHSDERPPRGTGDVPNGCGSAVLARQHDDCGPGQAIRRGPGGSAASKRRTVRREGFDILCYCRNVSLVTNSGARTISVTRRVLRRPNTKPVTVAQTSKR